MSIPFHPSSFVPILVIAVISACASSSTIGSQKASVAPLFRVCELQSGPSSGAQATFDDRHPLLTVSSIRSISLRKDRRSVLVRLNDADARAFATLTRAFRNRLLLLEAGADAVEVMHVTAPIEDGFLTFDDQDNPAIAGYLRRRFHLAEVR